MSNSLRRCSSDRRVAFRGSAGILPALAGILPASIRARITPRHAITPLMPSPAGRLEAGRGGQDARAPLFQLDGQGFGSQDATRNYFTENL